MQKIPTLRDRAVTVRPLDGGLTNRNFRIDAGSESYVLRIAGPDTELLGIDRVREEACLRAAEAVGVGPAIVASLPEDRALLSRFVAGNVLTEAATRDSEMIGRIAESLKKCHAAPIDETVGTFCVFATVRSYVALARERLVPLPADLPVALALLQRIEEEVASQEPPCLCHNDLLASNLIDDGMTIRIIDWEYAGRGDRFFDLGNLAVNLQFTADQEEILLCAYFGAVQTKHRRSLRLMRLGSDVREATWGFLQAAISQLHPQQYYLDYGRRHLERFISEAGSAGLSTT